MGRFAAYSALFLSLWLGEQTTRFGCSAFSLFSPQTKGTTSIPTSSQLYSTQTKVDISETAPRNGQYFVDWASYYGIQSENFQINPGTSGAMGSNWGAETSQAASAGSRVLFVPNMLRMTSQNARDQDFSNIASMIETQYIDPSKNDGEVALSQHFYLFLKILQEYDLGSESPYYPWMDAMPRTFSTALSFDDFEMSCLPPFVKFLADRDRENFNLFVWVLQQLNTPTISASTKANMQVLQWAFNIVFTRARPAYGGAEIIPMSDMMNHAWNANCVVQYDDDANVHVVLQRDVPAGEALSKCYGQPTNPSRFMSTYGFFDASPPTTYCKLMPSLLEQMPELANLGFDYNRMVFSVADGEVAPEVWDVMLYLGLASTNPTLQQEFYQAVVQGDDAKKARIHQQNMSQTVYNLLAHVSEVLEEIADCQEVMDQGGMGLAHKNLPTIRRHNEFVRQVFIKVQRNLQQM